MKILPVASASSLGRYCKEHTFTLPHISNTIWMALPAIISSICWLTWIPR